MQYLETRRQYNLLYFFTPRATKVRKCLRTYGFNFMILEFLTSLDVTYV